MFMFDGVGRSEEDLAQIFTLVTGMSEEAFNAAGRKTLRQLIVQVMTKDIKAVWLSPTRSAVEYDLLDKVYQFSVKGKFEDGRVSRTGTSIPDEMLGHLLLIRKTIFYEVWYRNLELREVARIFTKNEVKERVDNLKSEAGSETLKTGEYILDGALRAFREELGIDIGKNPIDVIGTSGDVIGPIQKSSVYAGCFSQQIYQRVRLVLPDELWPKLEKGNIYTDDGVEIHQVWVTQTKAVGRDAGGNS